MSASERITDSSRTSRHVANAPPPTDIHHLASAPKDGGSELQAIGQCILSCHAKDLTFHTTRAVKPALGDKQARVESAITLSADIEPHHQPHITDHPNPLPRFLSLLS
jgi:hypothetical protein